MESLIYGILQPDEAMPEVSLPFISIPKQVGFVLGLSLGLTPSVAQAQFQISDQCDGVFTLQNALIDQGFNPGGADGIFGQGTQEAVRQFQAQAGLEADGVVGLNTANALGIELVDCLGVLDLVSLYSPDPVGYQVPIGLNQGKISTDGGALNVRSGPGTDYEPIDSLANGTTVTFTGNQSGLWQELSGGGWISTAWVVPIDSTSPSPSPASPSPVSISPSASQAWVSTSGGSLNVRSGPGTDYPVVGEVANGTTISLSDRQDGDWLELTDGSWVAAGWLRFDPDSPSPSIASSVATAPLSGGDRTYKIIRGDTIETIANYLESEGFFSASSFIAATQDIPYSAFPWLPDGLSDLEGFLYPDTYTIAEGATPYQVIDQMLHAFEVYALPVYQSSGISLSLIDWVALASMVEKEAMVSWEKPTIAEVFLNRLELGMRLESDPTAEYALGYRQTPDAPLTLSEVRIDSPYNTYLYEGIPPGPIASPSQSSLEAVIYPEDHGYLYFVSCYDGTHSFNYNLEDHEYDRDTFCGRETLVAALE